MPLDEPTVAKAVLTLDHVPPGSPSASVVVLPTHTVAVPVIGAGAATTLTVRVAIPDAPAS